MGQAGSTRADTDAKTIQIVRESEAVTSLVKPAHGYAVFYHGGERNVGVGAGWAPVNDFFTGVARRVNAHIGFWPVDRCSSR